jgi:hypothetical protein
MSVQPITRSHQLTTAPSQLTGPSAAALPECRPRRLLAPRDRNKTLTALAGAEPVTGAGHRSVQRLRFFLSDTPNLGAFTYQSAALDHASGKS